MCIHPYLPFWNLGLNQYMIKKIAQIFWKKEFQELQNHGDHVAYYLIEN